MKKLLVLFLCTMLFSLSYSQVQVEITLGGGATIVDIEDLVDKDEVTGTTAEDWGQVSFGISGQVFYTSIGKIRIGTELMYQNLYWYEVEIPYGTQTLYRDYDISAFKLAQIFRYEIDESFCVDVGPEINFNDDGTMFGALCSVNYFIKINEKIDIPIKLRGEFMSLELWKGDKIIVAPVTINAGIRLKL